MVIKKLAESITATPNDILNNPNMVCMIIFNILIKNSV